jgi:hypothetical protein
MSATATDRDRDGNLLPAGPLYHGGRPGLRVGARILPPARTGVVTLGDVIREHDPLSWERWVRSYGCPTPGKVYAGTLEMALRYARAWTLNPDMPGLGAVYEVRPEGEVTADPSLVRAFPGLAVECGSAVITRVGASAISRELALSDPGQDYKERWLRELARARAEGRALTMDDHLAMAPRTQSLRAQAVASAGGAHPGALALRALGIRS